MAAGKRRRSSKKRSSKSTRRPAGKGVKLAGKKYNCYAKKVRTGKGRKKSTRAFCYNPAKK